MADETPTTSEGAAPSGEMSDDAIDSILSGIDAPNEDRIPISKTDEKTSLANESPKQKAADQNARESLPQTYTLKVNGKEITASLDQLKKYAEQGYSHDPGAFNKIQEENKNLQAFKQYQDYAQQNPDWLKHLHESWDKRTQPEINKSIDPNSPYAQELLTIKSELKELADFRNQLKIEKELETKKIADSALDDEIKKVRDTYTWIDWNKSDDTGLTMEQRVLKHGVSNGIGSFKTAFIDMNHETILNKSKEAAIENAVKSRQQATKAGVLGVSKTPLTSFKNAQDVGKKSYEDLAREALSEFEQGAYG